MTIYYKAKYKDNLNLKRKIIIDFINDLFNRVNKNNYKRVNSIYSKIYEALLK